MYRIIIAVVSIYLLVPALAIANNEISQNLFNQIKTNIEKRCASADYLNCIESSESICKNITQTQLKKISQILDAQSQAIADGQITQLLADLKTARSQILEENNIDIDKANSCGKQFLVN